MAFVYGEVDFPIWLSDLVLSLFLSGKPGHLPLFLSKYDITWPVYYMQTLSSQCSSQSRLVWTEQLTDMIIIEVLQSRYGSQLSLMSFERERETQGL